MSGCGIAYFQYNWISSSMYTPAETVLEEFLIWKIVHTVFQNSWKSRKTSCITTLLKTQMNNMAVTTLAQRRFFNFIIPLFIVYEIKGQIIERSSHLNCPVTISQCYCRAKYTTFNYIFCDNIGQLDYVPGFIASIDEYEELQIRYNSSITTVQNNAFSGLNIKSLRLQQLQIRVVLNDAFQGLEDRLTELHLDDNLLTSLSPIAISRLVKLKYVGLHNNGFIAVDFLGLTNLVNLQHIYLFNNNIQSLNSNYFNKLHQLRGLHLHKNDISFIEPGTFNGLSQLWDLELQDNFISDLSPNSFKDFVKLQWLDLSRNLIEYLNELIFFHMEELYHLDLSSNKLHHIPQNMFQGNAKITYLDISGNQLSYLENRTLQPLVELSELNLSGNKLTSFSPNTIGLSVNIRRLILSDNKIISIPHAILNTLSSLSYLDLSKNSLFTVSRNIFSNVTALTTLILSENFVTDINEDAFSKLPALNTIDLSCNNLTIVNNNWFSNITNLLILRLDKNQINTFRQGALKGLVNLRFLNLDNNALKILPHYIFEDTSELQTLSLAFNDFEKLEVEAFIGLGKLQYLHLQHNRITDIPERFFSSIHELKRLNLFSNKLSVIYSSNFYKTKLLEDLNLRNNSILSIHPNAFTYLDNLLRLDLSNNVIEYIRHPNVFNGLDSIEYIYLNHNNIIDIYKETIENLSTLKLLDLSSNPLNCDCRSEYLRGLTVLVNVADTKCARPSTEFPYIAICFPFDTLGCLEYVPLLNQTFYDLCGNTTSLSTSTISTTDLNDQTLHITPTTSKLSTNAMASQTQTSVDILPPTHVTSSASPVPAPTPVSTVSAKPTSADGSTWSQILHSTYTVWRPTLSDNTASTQPIVMPTKASSTIAKRTEVFDPTDQYSSIKPNMIKMSVKEGDESFIISWEVVSIHDVKGFRVSVKMVNDRSIENVYFTNATQLTIYKLKTDTPYVICVEALLDRSQSENLLEQCQEHEIHSKNFTTLLLAITITIAIVFVIIFTVTCALMKRRYDQKGIKSLKKWNSSTNTSRTQSVALGVTHPQALHNQDTSISSETLNRAPPIFVRPGKVKLLGSNIK